MSVPTLTIEDLIKRYRPSTTSLLWEEGVGESRYHRRWLSSEVSRLRKMILDGVSPAAAALVLGRARTSICSRMRKEKIGFGAISPERRFTMVVSRDGAEQRWSCRDIIRRVAAEYGVRPEDIIGPARLGELVDARHEAMWLAARDTKLSYPQIGRAFGRDHTTVIHAVRRVNAIKGQNIRGVGTVVSKRDRERVQ